jgi:amino-transferase class IV
VRIKIASWRRNSQNSRAAAKATGQYINSVLAKVESLKGGYDEAVMLNEAGFVTDGSGHAAYLKARPSVRRRFNQAVLEAVYVKDRRIARAEFSEVFAPLFSRPGSNKPLKVVPTGSNPCLHLERGSQGPLSLLPRVSAPDLESPERGIPTGQYARHGELNRPPRDPTAGRIERVRPCAPEGH